jgi:predicted RNA binding protein YcfA (HicA-like mRNA interferase family)
MEMLNEDGWYLARHQGTSHRQFKHPTKTGTVTINGKPSDDLPPFLKKSIFKQAGWE